MACTEPQTVNLQILKVPVNGPGDIDTLFIFTGTAVVAFDGQKELDACTLQLTLWPTIQAPSYGIFHPTTYLALSSVAVVSVGFRDVTSRDMVLFSARSSITTPTR
jgi:hypothetical protein